MLDFWPILSTVRVLDFFTVVLTLFSRLLIACLCRHTMLVCLYLVDRMLFAVLVADGSNAFYHRPPIKLPHVQEGLCSAG